MVLNMSDVNRKRITIVCMILLQRAGQKPGNNIFDYFLHQPGADGLGIAKIASRIVASSSHHSYSMYQQASTAQKQFTQSHNTIKIATKLFKD